MDGFSLAFAGIMLGTALLTVLLSLGRTESDKSGYLALILWATMGMITMAGAGNLMVIFLGLELLSLALYVKVAFDGRTKAREAALKYFVLGGVASAFILFGFALIYGESGTMALSAIKLGNTTYAKIGLGMSLVGFAFKLGLVPFHVWVPDVYEGAPTAITAFMSVGTKTAAFAGMARFLVNVLPANVNPRLLLPLAVFAAASMILGSTVGIWQTDMKRLLAYSGIANAGYLILAIPGLGAAGLSAGAYYLAAYGLTVMGIFAIISLLEQEGVEGSRLSALEGLYHRRPGLAAAFSLFMFALAGLPPTGGFMGKFLLAKAGVTAGGTNGWLLLTGLMVSTGISAYVYLKVIFTLFRPETQLGGSKRRVMAGGEETGLALSPGTIRVGIQAVLAVSLVGILLLGVLPNSAMQWLTVTIAK